MCKRLFSFLIITILFMLMCERSWGATATCTAFSETEGSPPSCPITFNSGTTVGVYSFHDGSSLRVEFVGGVKTSFSLTVTEFTLTDAQLAARLDPKVFPAGTTCFHYGGGCEEYAFTGNAGGPNGVPVKNVDYRAPIKLELTYFSSDPPNDPAFGHAPGESTTFSEDILTEYIKPLLTDDTMDGSTPSLSSVIALNKPLQQNDTFCWVSPTDGQIFRVGAEVEVAFKLFPSGPCVNNTGKAIRDSFARLSLARVDALGQVVAVVTVRSDDGGKHFQFDNEDRVNEREIDTEGLTPGSYVITVRSNKFPPQSRQIQLVAGEDDR
jgi:hypothetical protein